MAEFISPTVNLHGQVRVIWHCKTLELDLYGQNIHDSLLEAFILFQKVFCDDPVNDSN